jgi:ribosomal protein S15P/S13E
MEQPSIWIWYPWRKNPEPPTPAMPLRRALKNLHGAIYTELSGVQKKRQEEMLYGARISPERDVAAQARHPFLHGILKSLDGSAKGFPFWYKKYPTRRHAFENRFSIPAEMLDGYSANVKTAVSGSMMTNREKLLAQQHMYTERYAEHDFDTSSPAVLAVKLALRCRTLRQHLLTNPHNNIGKQWLARAERKLDRTLRRLRRLDFKRYWEIIREHDVQDMIQPRNKVTYRWGSYWFHDWNAGLAISTKISDFMDPRGMNGCIETGRSRAEVARDLGLCYTRTLNDKEKKQLTNHAMYYDRLARFKLEQPEAARQKERASFVRKFSGMFAVMNRKSSVPDFPSTFRSLLHSKILRWKSKRHGPT